MVSAFFWVGNHVGVDFLNTAAADDAGRAVELLDTWTALTDWFSQSRLVPGDVLERVPGGDRVPLLEWVRELRVEARAVIESPRDASATRALDKRLSTVPVRLTYSVEETSAEPVTADKATDRVRLALALAVLDATRLDPGRVRRCGREGCVLLFFDTSKNGARRWCDMAVCGNRVKAATHYRKGRG